MTEQPFVWIGNTRKSLVELPGRVRLLPGPNRVLEKRWKALIEPDVRETDGDEGRRGNRTVKKWLEAGLLEVLEGDQTPHPTKASKTERKRAGGGADNLLDYTIPQVRKMLKGVDDPDLLRKWQDADERQGVHDAIDARLGELEE